MKRIAILTESELHNIVFESARYMLLTESTKDVRNRMMRVVPEETMKELLGTRRGYNDLIEDAHGNEIPLIVDLYNKIRVHAFEPFANSNFLPGLYRIAITELGWNTEDIDTDNMDLLVKMVYELLQSGEKLDWNLNNMSFFDLYKLYGMRIEDEKENENETNSKEKKGKVNNGYTIIKIESFREANFYGNESCPSGKLCYTQSPRTFTEYGGLTTNSVYVCLKDGWKDIQPTPGKNAPFDEYGLSMIFVFVNSNGNIAYCNTRWNHKYSEKYNVDHILTKNDLSKILGINFDSIFKPLNYVNANFTFRVNDAIKKLIRGVNPKYVFDKIENFDDLDSDKAVIVWIDKKCNVLIENKLVTPKRWYTSISKMSDAKGCYILEGRYSNWLNLNIENYIVSKKWYSYVTPFNEYGIAIIDVCDNNNCGFNWVSFDDPEHAISDIYHESIDSNSTRGIYTVQFDDYEFNWVDIFKDPTEKLSDRDYWEIRDTFNKQGTIVVGTEDGYNWVRINDLEHPISKVYYLFAENFNDQGIAIVNLLDKGKYNFVHINNPEKKLSKIDFDCVSDFDEKGFSKVEYNNKIYEININNLSQLLNKDTLEPIEG